ncbi:hypothetical protein DW322_06525 [Rhodococcus rhodnii]|uniref:Uncharacterized protein n=2 Tax=Rhodococcus rhodnii TaxID=38312 RepID=R7WNZ1_9NOCA|nr:hypothetical protein [Rhodococcus rhodnii]EOM76990.1 hypothetical protein Rrhod_1609 [Rhodococcus rhodnii LMG 5362]TXG89930.1 hypothetical protein DW322_06525 [Rhodococcus rhodnii]
MIAALLTGLCDDAALFPPGDAPMPAAVVAHAGYRSGDVSPLVGPFVVPVGRLGELAEQRPAAIDLSVTFPAGPAELIAGLDAARAIDGVRVAAVEIASGAELSASDFAAAVTAAADALDGVDVYVEIPRGERRPGYLAVVAENGWRAKFRTGGVVAEAYPDEAELAAAVHRVVASGVPFKATAGLHHAVRNTDPVTGFEQHGFVNLLVATADALAGATPAALVDVLGERDGATLAARLNDLDDDTVRAVRGAFRSYGTCSIAEPVADLTDLGLLELDAELVANSEGQSS